MWQRKINRISLNIFVPAFLSFMVRFAKIFGTYTLLSFLMHVLYSAITVVTLLFTFKCYIHYITTSQLSTKYPNSCMPFCCILAKEKVFIALKIIKCITKIWVS